MLQCKDVLAVFHKVNKVSYETDRRIIDIAIDIAESTWCLLDRVNIYHHLLFKDPKKKEFYFEKIIYNTDYNSTEKRLSENIIAINVKNQKVAFKDIDRRTERLHCVILAFFLRIAKQDADDEIF